MTRWACVCATPRTEKKIIIIPSRWRVTDLTGGRTRMNRTSTVLRVAGGGLGGSTWPVCKGFFFSFNFFFFLPFGPFPEREPPQSGVDVQQRRNRVKETERCSGVQRRTNYLQEWPGRYDCRRLRHRRRLRRAVHGGRRRSHRDVLVRGHGRHRGGPRRRRSGGDHREDDADGRRERVERLRRTAGKSLPKTQTQPCSAPKGQGQEPNRKDQVPEPEQLKYLKPEPKPECYIFKTKEQVSEPKHFETQTKPKDNLILEK